MPLFLVRHASAGVRDDADPDDDDRALDATGHQQAERLSQWLRLEEPGRILSSPLLRCRQTVQPLATAVGGIVEVDARLGEGSPIDVVWDLLSTVGATTAVLCSHGDVIPEVISRAQRRGMVVPGKLGCSKGSVWSLDHWDGRTFASGVYTPVKV